MKLLASSLIRSLPKFLSRPTFYPSFRFCESYRMISSDPTIVAVCQLNCTSDRVKNFETCRKFINIAASHNAKMVFLPECFDHVGESKKQSIELAEPLDGPLMSEYRKIAKTSSVWLSLGGFHEKNPSIDEERVYNSHVIIDSNGEIASVYRKIHLFEIDIPGGVRLRESDFSIPGNAVVSPVKTPIGNVGLGICYDLRFPEFALSLTKAGADILTYPSAFTQTTGMAHWEPLLRSRAIETQTYVIAAAQTGKHNAKRVSYGHAMVVDPWGCVVACSSEGEGVIFAEIKTSMLNKIRTEMPVMMHRREDLYGRVACNNGEIQTTRKYMFGDIELHPDFIFYKTHSSMAFVNRKVVVPGHVLVSPLHCAKRLSDLLPSEVADLFLCVQKVQRQIEIAHEATSSTIAVQDGPEAGQTIPHVHVHILPRKTGDIENNDDIYEKLYSHDKQSDKWRTNEDMLIEANNLKKYFL